MNRFVLRKSAARFGLVAAFIPAFLPTGLRAENVIKDAVNKDIAVLRSGPLLIHGNYCGIGNRPGKDPIDALDTACMHHDGCTRTGKLPSCACDNALRAEAETIAKDPQTPPNIQVLALAVVGSMAVLVCK